MIKVYSTPACPYCETLKEYLKQKGFDFEAIDVSQDKEAFEEMKEKSGQMGVPVIDINGQIVVGLNKGKIQELLNIQN